jgi:DNA-binding protein H-NS
MYQQAMELVLKNSKPSISFVQRQLKIGYNRAARLIEDMEKAGLVSAMDKSGQRQVKAAKPVTCPYRGPNGETWSGRGLMPRWLGVLVQAGQDKESFRVPA